MKLLVDMNLSPRWVDFLREMGFEAIHWSAVGPGGAPDAEIMEWAAKRGCIVLTADLDFGAALAATNRREPSVMQLRSDTLSPQAIGNRVVAALLQAAQELREGALVSVDPSRARLRILPLTE
jgi:predicted nuclease of predicted toxin-antitoxin system